ncbi:MAG: glycoside hydrolase family 57 protein [Candidatus Gastranaerophilales bacterium]|nr:glycoside hydrolase family 57 protein [Candidatus Gastranaerophilales bacterium]
MHKNLSIAFIWHMHQPNYQAQPNGIRLMPWARLHAIKDYLDMLLQLDNFPDLKLNFNLVPVLVDAIEEYAHKGAHDIHSKLTVTPIDELTEDDKQYILNYFFDANYANLISHHKYYSDLYHKRYLKEEVDISDFSEQEYSDIMMWFNLVWFDPRWIEEYPELKSFIEQERGFSLAQRVAVIDIQRQIMARIIPEFKKYQDEGRIEITTSPYYHPILPIMFDMNVAKKSAIRHPLPDCKINMAEDAKTQIKMALDKMEQTFGKRPVGMWPSEHCVSQKTLDCFADLGIKWTVSDEGILANTLKKEFVRDFKGYLEDPYDLCNAYTYESKNHKPINIVFRDSVIPNLISFEYPHHESVIAASDLYSRIKTIQNKLQNSPDEHHLLTIAMDGENSWESYANDGAQFLKTLYKLITRDETLHSVLVSDYIKEVQHIKKLDSLAAGSWINRDFQLWIAEPTKNLAWKYLCHTEEDLKIFAKEKDVDKRLVTMAKNELYIAQGSDWFWWYGEPNDSGQDHIFDYLFREHLKNIYLLLGKKVPKYLDSPLISFLGKPSRAPKKQISPHVNGKDLYNDEWINAGCIDIPAGPIPQENKLFNRICFGCDETNIYLRFDINRFIFDMEGKFKSIYQIYVYFKSYNEYAAYTAPIRTVNKPDYLFPILKDGYSHELKITLFKDVKSPMQFSKAQENNLWVLQMNNNVKYAYEDIVELCIPFFDLNISPGEKIDFFIINGTLGLTEEVYPQDMLLSLERPRQVQPVESN